MKTITKKLLVTLTAFSIIFSGLPFMDLSIFANAEDNSVILSDTEVDPEDLDDNEDENISGNTEDKDDQNEDNQSEGSDTDTVTEPTSPVLPAGGKPYMLTKKNCTGTYEERYTKYETIEFQLLAYPTSKIIGERYIAPVYYYTDSAGKEVLYIINDKGEVDYDGPVEGKMELKGGGWSGDKWNRYHFTFTEIKNYKGYTYYFETDGSFKEMKSGDISLSTAMKLDLTSEDLKKNGNGVCATGNATFDAFINDPRYKPQQGTFPGMCGTYAGAFVDYCFPSSKYTSKTFTNMQEIQAGDIIQHNVGDGHVVVILKRKGQMIYCADAGHTPREWDGTIEGIEKAHSSVHVFWSYIYPDRNNEIYGLPNKYTGTHYILKSESEYGPGSTSIKSIKASKKALTVKWKKAAYTKGLKASDFDAEGYQIKISTSKSFKNPRYITAYGTSKTIKKLKSKKTYYIKIRAWNYDEAGEYKIYSKWSSVKSKKTK